MSEEKTEEEEVTTDSSEESTILSEEEKMQEKYQLRDLSKFSISKMGDRYKTSLSNSTESSNCLYFDCLKNVDHCDNANPRLGLDYAAAFGTLLGFTRGDRVIPWTIDNDYIIPSEDAANVMVILWDSKRTGMAHIFQTINRGCV